MESPLRMPKTRMCAIRKESRAGLFRLGQSTRLSSQRRLVSIVCAMTISAVRYINFKKYRDISFDFSKPITVLVGPNSSGKSSLIKGLLAFKQTYEDPTDHAGFVSQGEYVDIGHFNEYVTHHNSSLETIFIFELNLNLRQFINRRDIVDLSRAFVEITHQEDPQTKHGRVSSYRIFIPEHRSTSINEYKLTRYRIEYIRMQKSEEAFRVSLTKDIFALLSDRMRRHSAPTLDEGLIATEYSILHKSLSRSSFQSNRNNQQGMSSNYSKASYSRGLEIFVSLERLVVQTVHSVLFGCLTTQMFALAGLREKPSRSAKRTDENRVVGSSGANTASVYFSLRQKAKKAGKRQSKTSEDFDELERWFAEMRLGEKIEISGWRDLIDMRTRTKENRASDSIVDVGVGFSQAAPILVQLAAMPENTILIVEQPELHLYPWAQTKLGSIFCTEAFRRKKRLIVETHSEHFIHGIQLHISESRRGGSSGLRSSDVQILYIDHSGDIREMKLNEFGEFIDEWPDGFFDQTLNVYRKILKNKLD